MKYLIILFTSMLILASCSKTPGTLNEPDLVNANAGRVAMTIVKDSIPADSITFASLAFAESTSLYAKYKQVTFSISPVGRFSNDSASITVSFDSSRTAHTLIFSNQSGWSYITALVGNITSVDSIYFSPVIDTIILTNPSC